MQLVGYLLIKVEAWRKITSWFDSVMSLKIEKKTTRRTIIGSRTNLEETTRDPVLARPIASSSRGTRITPCVKLHATKPHALRCTQRLKRIKRYHTSPHNLGCIKWGVQFVLAGSNCAKSITPLLYFEKKSMKSSPRSSNV